MAEMRTIYMRVDVDQEKIEALQAAINNAHEAMGMLNDGSGV